MEDTLSSLGLGRYERGARLAPAILVLMPVFLLAAVWLPDFWSLIGGFAALGLFGGSYLMMGLARSAGLKAERRLEAELGTRPTTACLRHGTDWLNVETRERYHAKLRQLGLKIPTASEQRVSPQTADDCYASAVDRLRELTRGAEHDLIQSENIHYGFRRNLRGLKPLALGVVALCLLVDVTALFVLTGTTDMQISAAAAMLAVFIATGAIWAFAINDSFVREASWAYARRLLASCETLGEER